MFFLCRRRQNALPSETSHPVRPDTAAMAMVMVTGFIGVRCFQQVGVGRLD